MSEARIVPGLAKPRGRYPHVKLAGGLAFVSGTSSRRPDDTIAGAEVDAAGEVHLDIRVQTRGGDREHRHASSSPSARASPTS